MHQEWGIALMMLVMINYQAHLYIYLCIRLVRPMYAFSSYAMHSSEEKILQLRNSNVGQDAKLWERVRGRSP